MKLVPVSLQPGQIFGGHLARLGPELVALIGAMMQRGGGPARTTPGSRNVKRSTAVLQCVERSIFTYPLSTYSRSEGRSCRSGAQQSAV
jgi:hypothetical protein